jgi:hypothetical protein
VFTGDAGKQVPHSQKGVVSTCNYPNYPAGFNQHGTQNAHGSAATAIKWQHYPHYTASPTNQNPLAIGILSIIIIICV